MSIRPAQLVWKNGRPYSGDLADIYFSDAGLSERRTVFLAHNQLPQRWMHWPHPVFCVGELGFGCGLNFLVTWQAFLTHAPAQFTLHYHTVEKFPLKAADLARVYAMWPELGMLGERLLSAYPPLRAGVFTLHFERVVLHLHFADAAEFLPALPMAVDAWYLDGFAPAKNPALWEAALLQQVAQRSAPQATFATFSAAGSVRRALQDAGFAVEKVPGVGRKREMLRGQRLTVRP